MRGLSFEEVFALLAAVQLSSADLARLREWLAGIAHPAECIALIEGAAAGRPCPHCGCARKHRCGHASGLQRFRCVGERHSRRARPWCDPCAERQRLAQPFQQPAGAFLGDCQPLPDPLFGLAAGARRATLDDACAPALRSGPSCLAPISAGGASVIQLTRTQPKKRLCSRWICELKRIAPVIRIVELTHQE
jgi:hypothetical protein